MIIILKNDASESHVEEVRQILNERQYGINEVRGVEKTIICAIGAPDADKPQVASQLEAIPGVERVMAILKPYKLVSREGHPDKSIIKVRDVEIGGDQLVVMAGPCTVETEEQLMKAAHAVKKAGAHILRGGAYKPSTSPYSFHGHGVEGLKILAKAREETGLPIITEVLDPRHMDEVCEYADMLQIGMRNMSNFQLLREVGRSKKPCMLKRGQAAKIEEWLQAAEYIASEGNFDIVLCERGIRTFETATRNTFDINAIPATQALTHLPIVADPAHGTGMWQFVPPIAKAAVAAGADSLMIEVHPEPWRALKDGGQSLTISDFTRLMQEIEPIAKAVGKHL
ncbi:MAG: 3-deoxy-7-phosphoheptulonate synthase [Armatimonadetes bacterium]|nr:3-deoxy-7-phosphoheptulonate synthase [Armatimonadota bacterium]